MTQSWLSGRKRRMQIRVMRRGETIRRPAAPHGATWRPNFRPTGAPRGGRKTPTGDTTLRAARGLMARDKHGRAMPPNDTPRGELRPHTGRTAVHRFPAAADTCWIPRTGRRSGSKCHDAPLHAVDRLARVVGPHARKPLLHADLEPYFSLPSAGSGRC